VRELSRGFTRGRSLSGTPYMDDPGLLGGYLLFYWPVSYAQAWAAVLSAEVISTAGVPSGASALDLGCGPGPACFALQDMGFRTVTAVDRSQAALDLLRELASAAGRTVDARRADLERPGALAAAIAGRGPFDLIVAMHTLNELWGGSAERVQLRAALVAEMARALSPRGHVLVVEPALTSTANDAITLRDQLLAAGWRVESPCTFAGKCPALPDGTCHAEVQWEPPRDLVRLAHAARIGRESLAFTYFLMAPPGAAAAPGFSAHAYRVVSERFLSKSGRLRFLVCGPEGRFPLSVDGKAGFEAARALRGLKRYDLVRFEGAQKRETGYGLTADSRLWAIRPAPRIGS
jgi:SAM-dependent methyltransferase